MDYGVAELRGRTLTGGVVVLSNDQLVVRFADRVDEAQVVAIVRGQPGLEALVAEFDAAELARSMTRAFALDSIGWPAYKAILRAAQAARAAYQASANHRSGNRNHEGELVRQADDALAVYGARYPGARAYAQALDFATSLNVSKATAGRLAVKAIESGEDPLAAAARLVEAWPAPSDVVRPK